MVILMVGRVGKMTTIQSKKIRVKVTKRNCMIVKIMIEIEERTRESQKTKEKEMDEA